jgi:metal-dependent amidase/aminoacylase/carboxypeptidase family protein
MNTIKITILDDGTIRSETDEFSAAVHETAEQFLRGVTALTGGEVERRAKTGVSHVHTHADGTVHSHE